MVHRGKDENEVRSRAFAMRVNATERRMLAALAKKLRRSRSDTVRLLVREALRELNHAEKRTPVASEPAKHQDSEGEEVSDGVS